MLLGLQPARIDVDQAGELGKPHHPVDRLVGDMRLAHERHHVMLAMGVERDVAHQHEIVVTADLAEGALQHVGRRLRDSRGRARRRRRSPAWACRADLRGRDCRRHRRSACAPPPAPPRARASAPPAGGADAHVIGQGLVGSGRFRPRLDDGIHRGLSVRPARRPGVSPGRPHRSYAHRGFHPCAATGRRIPILHGFVLAAEAIRPDGIELVLAPAGPVPIYSSESAVQSSCRLELTESIAMLNDVYNSRILELAGNIPRLGRLDEADATRDRPFQALRLDRHRRPQNGRRHRHRLRP